MVQKGLFAVKIACFLINNKALVKFSNCRGNLNVYFIKKDLVVECLGVVDVFLEDILNRKVVKKYIFVNEELVFGTFY